MKDDELFKKLDEVQKAYEATLTISLIAAQASARVSPPEPPRNVFYPLGFALDMDAARALVE